ncbi:glycerate kinase [Lacisediminihabitans changchengi]|uniref:Glycerate kinase n=1 Tax=Lacisediminihabitans changchengi TaxID=2787634 RepID=A0A934SRQ7_9MICO|nr:glycerate kinase [Lacisediminihabitans changchengi]MBK4347079.1 glycerate kinase [Lacisediminihabitans changchengi]MBK4347798.1 glycerate kinase [Lacisediminihabitans changchengi]
MRRRIVIAPDSFKGSATASEIAEAIAAGWHSVRADDDLVLRPMADGGEGTMAAIVAAVDDSRLMPITVDGPDDRPVHTHWALLPGGIGVVELANTSGLGLLDPLRPFHAHTRGFGQAIAAALEAGVSQLQLAIGGSSSSDGGVGALRALGARFVDAHGAETPDGNAGLATLAAVQLDGLRALPVGGVQVLTDVRSPLLGETGASYVFGAQKGASADDLPLLERNLGNLLSVIRQTSIISQTSTDAVALSTRAGAGAAGGTGFGLSLWGATSSSGADSVAQLIGLDEAIRDTDLVVTGEGRFDEQTGEGKVVDRVRATADAHGVPTALVAGLISAAAVGFAASTSLTALAGSGAAAYADPLTWARVAGAELAKRFEREFD